MRPAPQRRQRGVALLAMLAVIGLGVSWFLVSRLNADSNLLTAIKRERNAEVLNKAKQTLMGYIAAQAAKSNENRPGAFPCPEAPGNFNSADNDGTILYPCTPPVVGRFPWRSLGLDKLVDVAGEPLWYAVAAGWAGANTVINSNCASYDAASTQACRSGRLTIDGVTGDVVAIIIAPGAALINQTRPTTAPPNWSNWLEGENATYPTADATFATTGSSGSFNDQVVTITTFEILPLIEAAIAHRIEREIAPKIRSAYSSGAWASTPVFPYAVTFADPSANPANKLQGTSGTTQGLLPGSYAFVPDEYSSGEGSCSCDPPNTAPCVCKENSQLQRSLEPCTVGSDNRCDPSFVSWRSTTPCGAAFCTTATSDVGSYATLQAISCTVSGTPSTLTCTIDGNVGWIDVLLGRTAMTFTLRATANNAGMALRQATSPGASSRAPQITGIDTSYVTSPIGYSLTATSSTLNTDGSGTVAINARFASGSGSALAVLGALTCDFFGIPLCYRYTLSVPMAVLGDNPVVDPDNSTYSWFHRNKWHEVAYYAVAPTLVPSGSRSCTTGTDCLTVAYHRTTAGVVDAGAQRAILMLSGRSLTGATRPWAGSVAATKSDWFEGVNATSASALGSSFELRSSTLLINRTFNDRISVLDSN